LGWRWPRNTPAAVPRWTTSERWPAPHTAKVGTTALGTIRSVEYVIQNLDETVANLEQQIATTQKRLADLTVQAAQPFEYAERLATLTQRRQEIEDALDLTKNQASAQLGADTPKELPVAEPDADSLKESHEGEWY
jgi:paraquat-inducible protein B